MHEIKKNQSNIIKEKRDQTIYDRHDDLLDSM
jgi:hypothetical protein